MWMIWLHPTFLLPCVVCFSPVMLMEKLIWGGLALDLIPPSASKDRPRLWQ